MPGEPSSCVKANTEREQAKGLGLYGTPMFVKNVPLKHHVEKRVHTPARLDKCHPDGHIHVPCVWIQKQSTVTTPKVF